MQPTREFVPPPLKITASVVTDRGCVRESNEDNGRHVEARSASADERSVPTLTIVADGMGGHNSGEVASEMAVDLISRYFYDNDQLSTGDALRFAIEQASAEIFEAAATDAELAGMGTTVVALAIDGNLGIAAHVGDSRLYRLRGTEMERMTLDHSQVMEMVKMGILSLEQAQDHEDKNVILRAVGTQPFVEVELSEPFSIGSGDQFLLCSDGLSDMVIDEDIRRVWANAAEPHIASQHLIELAKARGGHDNVTVGIVSLAYADSEPVARKVPQTRHIEV